MYCWNKKLLIIALCWQYSIKISKLMGVWPVPVASLSAVMTPVSGWESVNRPSPTFHLPFPGYTADKSSYMTWMWPDRLDCDLSPTGYDFESWQKSSTDEGCGHYVIHTRHNLSDIIQQRFEIERHICFPEWSNFFLSTLLKNSFFSLSSSLLSTLLSLSIWEIQTDRELLSFKWDSLHRPLQETHPFDCH